MIAEQICPVFTAFPWTFRGDKVWLGGDKDLFFLFPVCKFGLLWEVPLLVDPLLPPCFLSLEEVIKIYSKCGGHVCWHVSSQELIQ